MTDYRRFNRTDWMAWAGAESFGPNSDPFIWEKTLNEGLVTITVLVDKTGIEVDLVSDDLTEEPCVFSKEMNLNSIRAEGELKNLIKVLDLYEYAPDITYELDHPTHEATKGFVYNN